MLLLSGIFIY